MCPADCLGALHHDCGSCWQTHGTLGPKDGKTWGLRLADVESGHCGVAQRGLGKSRVLDVQGVVILIFGPHFRYFFAFLGNLAQKVVGPGNWRFNSEAQHVAGGGDGARLGAKHQSLHEPHHIRSLGGEAGAQSRGRAGSVRANGARSNAARGWVPKCGGIGVTRWRKEQLEKGRANLAGK